MGLGPTPSSSPLPTLLTGVCSGESDRPNGQPRGECSGTVSCLPGSGDRYILRNEPHQVAEMWNQHLIASS